jgi:hypothetical protein
MRMDEQVKTRVHQIEELLDRWGTESQAGELTDAQFIELCDEMAVRGQAAADARREEIGEMDTEE